MIAGIDEAGRGALAGPVVSALVIFHPSVNPSSFKDSKILSKKQRLAYYTDLKKSQSIIIFSIINNRIIDQINILQATLKSMANCINQLPIKPSNIIIDGSITPKNTKYIAQSCIKGDQKIAEISAASIIAKVIRDSIMSKYQRRFYPKFQFSIHKGYGTPQHYNEINHTGITPIHRQSFNLHQQLPLF